MAKSNPHGDDQGTRIGSPDAGSPSQRNQSSGATGAGAEAAEGIHSADGSRDPSDQSAIEGQPTGRGSQPASASGDVARSGSEPLVDRENEHRSGYGGAAGKPVKSSDQREPKGG
jgi:hypothetical protein